MNKVVNWFGNVLLLSLLFWGGYSLITYEYGKHRAKMEFAEVNVTEEYRQLNCLAENIYYEAAGESLPGKIAVGQVTINRVKSGYFKPTICGVVHQSSQFSWTIDKPRALLLHERGVNKEAWQTSMQVARKILFEGERLQSVGDSLFYHTTAIKPSWANKFQRVTVVGNHIYYRITNGKI